MSEPAGIEREDGEPEEITFSGAVTLPPRQLEGGNGH
jgi:hypothetical protein